MAALSEHIKTLCGADLLLYRSPLKISMLLSPHLSESPISFQSICPFCMAEPVDNTRSHSAFDKQSEKEHPYG
ncbi:hypothetical protein GCD22_01492 [Acidithiobacillus thiooxidans ATCC 19377]|uniref:Uncharacterized protein n=1 Tax=Acidithiobacillus thiooxidans ATCC 19377 TaxID=637390 RepID=A0A5P9XPB7_ACITH|nr:hypothetical protein GCD22_01492 [Acidithiobacillus thiooxidans ATCC 19377]